MPLFFWGFLALLGWLSMGVGSKAGRVDVSSWCNPIGSLHIMHVATFLSQRKALDSPLTLVLQNGKLSLRGGRNLSKEQTGE